MTRYLTPGRARCYPIPPYRMHETRLLFASPLVGRLTLAHSSAQSRQIQVGFCTPLANIDAAKAAGFDYVELSTTEIAGLSDAAFEEAATHIRQAGISTPAANLFLPATLKVTGPATD